MVVGIRVKKKAVILSYGKGGHQEQMQRLVVTLQSELPKDTDIIVMTDSKTVITTEKKILASFHYSEARDKHSTTKTLLGLPKLIVTQFLDSISLNRQFEIVGIISTGPGVSIIPSMLCKLFGKKVIAFESWSRFYHSSLTGKVLYKVSDLFFIQNKTLQTIYPKAIYRGRL